MDLGLLPLDQDCLSMEYDGALRDFVQDDPTPVYAAARALMQFQKLFGSFTNVKVRVHGGGGNVAIPVAVALWMALVVFVFLDLCTSRWWMLTRNFLLKRGFVILALPAA